MSDQPAVVNGNTVVEATGLIAAVATLVSSSTATIMARLDAIERGEMDRWRQHDEELARNRLAIAAKFLTVEERLDAHMVVANAHFGRQHDDDIAMDARVRPVRIAVAWAASHWKDLAILAVAVLGLFAVTADILSRYLGGPP